MKSARLRVYILVSSFLLQCTSQSFVPLWKLFCHILRTVTLTFYQYNLTQLTCIVTRCNRFTPGGCINHYSNVSDCAGAMRITVGLQKGKQGIHSLVAHYNITWPCSLIWHNAVSWEQFSNSVVPNWLLADIAIQLFCTSSNTSIISLIHRNLYDEARGLLGVYTFGSIHCDYF